MSTFSPAPSHHWPRRIILGLLAVGLLIAIAGAIYENISQARDRVRSDVAPEGRNSVPAVSNYLLGNDPSRRIRGVPNQSQVLNRQIYLGLTWFFTARGTRWNTTFESRLGVIRVRSASR